MELSGSVFLGQSANRILIDFLLHLLVPLFVLLLFFSSWGLFKEDLFRTRGFVLAPRFILE